MSSCSILRLNLSTRTLLCSGTILQFSINARDLISYLVHMLEVTIAIHMFQRNKFFAECVREGAMHLLATTLIL